MADDVEMIPVDAAEPPKANPLAAPAAPKGATIKLSPVARKPVLGGGSAPGFRPGLKLPTSTLKPGLKLPPKPVIRKPNATVSAAPLPKPVAPVAVDAQGVGKLPTVEAKAVDRNDTTPTISSNPIPLESLKTMTQKLKGITQEIPQQAILHKTGIIADGAVSEAQKEASKHKTARISLSDAMGVAPVKNENAPMKTIRIKRPIDIPGVTPKAETPAPATPAEASTETKPATPAAAPAAAKPAAASPTMTQRKTLKISRPGGVVRPTGKFSPKRPAAAAAPAVAEPKAATETPIADIADIPDIPPMSLPKVEEVVDEGPAWLVTLSMLVQMAACVAMGALAWFLFENTQTVYF